MPNDFLTSVVDACMAGVMIVVSLSMSVALIVLMVALVAMFARRGADFIRDWRKDHEAE